MNKGALIASLLGTYEGKRGEVPLSDEDFAPDPSGDWVKLDGAWRKALYAKYLSRSIDCPFIKTWTGDTPEWVKEVVRKHDAYCAKVDALPKHRLITSWEQRAVRHATLRAEEILKASA